jgi:uncharacterized coiled-coil DUF342 family protein
MSAEFSNKYQEILLENFMSVVKQNLVFQTQIQLTDPAIKERDNLKDEIVKIKKQLQECKDEISHLHPFKEKFNRINDAKEDGNRIQIALNDYMKKYNKLKFEFDEMQTYVSVLEVNVPATKLKKLKKEEEKIVTTPENRVVDVNTF